MDRELINYLPPVLREVRELALLMGVEQEQLEALWDTAYGLLDNQFLDSAGELGVSRWESLLKITPKATETLEERKFTILAKINTSLPYTIRELHNQLTRLCGEDEYTVTLDADKYALTVLLALTSKHNFNTVQELLSWMVPANLLLTVTLKYNQHISFTGVTHAEMAAYTQGQLREEVF